MITHVMHRDWGRDRTFGLLGAPITAVKANAVAVALNEQHIPVAVTVDETLHVVHLWPWVALTTEQQVTALRAFIAVTDYHITPHPALAA
jgi:hypothetical protein